MFGIIDRLKRALGFADEPYTVAPADQIDHEEFDPEEFEEFEVTEEDLAFSLDPIQEAAQERVEEADWSPDAIGVDTDEDEFVLLEHAGKFEAQAGTERRITVPSEIRMAHDLEGEEVWVDLMVYPDEGEPWGAYFDATVWSDGRFEVPEPEDGDPDLEQGDTVGVIVYEVAERHTPDLSEYE